MRSALFYFSVAALFCFSSRALAADEWRTFDHSPGQCATYGTCGHRKDSTEDFLPCAINKPAESLPSSTALKKFQQVCPQLAAELGPDPAVCCTEDQLDILQKSIQQASIFLVGCPACNHNFKSFFCLLTCSPDQATFANITAVQDAVVDGDIKSPSPAEEGRKEERKKEESVNNNAVAEMDIYISPVFGENFYNSCSDVIFAPLNIQAMSLVGGGAKNYQEWLDFIGLLKDRRFPPQGSPFQINFPSIEKLPKREMKAMNGTMVGCGDSPFACSCGDCPSAANCKPPEPPPPPPAAGCPALHTPGPFTCLDLTFLAVFLAIAACIPAFISFVRSQQVQEAQYFSSSGGGGDGFGVGVEGGPLEDPLLDTPIEDSQDEITVGGSSAPAAAPLLPPVGQQPSAATAAMLLNSNTASTGAAPPSAAVNDEDEIIEYPITEEIIRSIFRWIGFSCAIRPWRTLGVCTFFLVLAMLGIVHLQLVTEPAKLWVGPGSQAAAERKSYEAAFGPFYRISQLILSTNATSRIDGNSTINNNGSAVPPAITNDENIRLLFAIQAEVDALAINTTSPQRPDQKESITLQSVCFKPLGDACATQSVLEYWQGSLDNYDGSSGGPKLSPEFCYEHWNIACRASTGAPVDPKVVLGGFPPLAPPPEKTNSSTSTSITSWYAETATAFIITYPLSSSLQLRQDVEAWEAAFLKLAQGKLTDLAKSKNLLLSFSAERSVEDELKRESNADAGTVAKSYLMMVLYVALALSTIPSGANLKTALVHGKTLLALGGVLLVAAVVAAALGICGWLGINATLIIMEVIPFLALAIGVDNVFILTQASEKIARTSSISPAARAAGALASAGPSMLLAATAETMGFAVGTLTSMPALRDFAACAALAIATNFLLQVAAMPALLALDAKRVEERRYDFIPWMKAPAPWMEEEDEQQQGETSYEEEEEEENIFGGGGADGGGGGKPAQQRSSRYCSNYTTSQGGWGVGPFLQWYMQRLHAPFLSSPIVKGIIILIFSGLTLFSCAMLPRLEKGLDQRVALPQDSYLQKYFSDVTTLLRVGPPVSFVVENLNISDSREINKICSVAGCDDDSLLNRISQGARTPWQSSLASPASSWLDDFLSWVSPEIPQCCRVFPNSTFCPPPDQFPCFDPTIIDDPDQSTHLCDSCYACFAPEDLPPGSIPGKNDFITRLPQFMQAKPSEQCAKGGVGAYSNSIQRDTQDVTGIKGLSEGVVSASAFLSYYHPLSKQQDFIAAVRSSRDLATQASKDLNITIFSYSIFHVFFEQYLTLGGEALTMLGSAAVAIFVLCLIATSSPWAAALVLGTLTMLCIDLAGVMAVAGIQANAVSLVNLAAAVGIGVEFCVHIMHAFMEAPGTKEQRIAAALTDVGAAVLSGITATKLVGVAVLAGAHTAIFRIYFFKFYLALVVLGALHGLVFLPIVLSVVGPEAFHHWRLRRKSKDGLSGRSRPNF
ncbi:hypothetical protein Ndes2526A_g06428 [Nannochloris sp. 'desiccata']